MGLRQQMTPMSIVAMMVTLCGIGISVLGRGEHHRVSLKLPLNGVLYAIGAALCQGVGLVLSKIGMDCYQTDAEEAWLVLLAFWAEDHMEGRCRCCDLRHRREPVLH